MKKYKNYLVSVGDVEPLEVGEQEGFKGVDSRLLISEGTVGPTSSCMFRAVFPPGAYHASHVHLKSDELLYCISGEAKQSIGDRVYLMKAGDAMIIPRGQEHWMRNDGRVPFEVIGVYPDASSFDDTDQHLI